MHLAAGLLSADGFGPQLLIFVAAVGALWTLVKTVPKVTGGIARVDSAARQIIGDGDKPGIVARQEIAETALLAVQNELKPNGGSSLRDVVNKTASDVAAAKNTALEAKDAATQVAAELVISNEQAQRERERISRELKEGRGMVTALLNGLDEFAATNHQKEIAYIRALKALGIDLTQVADHLENGITDET